LNIQTLDVRWRAADALGKIGDEAAIPGLLKLVEDSDSDVRKSVADALGKIGSEAAIPGLLKLVEDSDYDVRSSAADCVRQNRFRGSDSGIT
jgi:HEAT repeat protein